MGQTPMICTTCGHVGKPKQLGFGQGLIGGLLLTAGILPGIVYFAALGSRYPCCALCRQKNIVPLNSPFGRRLAEEAGINWENDPT